MELWTNTSQELIPFAVVGSEKTVVVNGQNVRGRQTKWGVINGTFRVVSTRATTANGL